MHYQIAFYLFKSIILVCTTSVFFRRQICLFQVIYFLFFGIKFALIDLFKQIFQNKNNLFYNNTLSQNTCLVFKHPNLKQLLKSKTNINNFIKHTLSFTKLLYIILLIIYQYVQQNRRFLRHKNRQIYKQFFFCNCCCVIFLILLSITKCRSFHT